jgi:acetylornithine/succinyldiaminopimelate/putrescine aminotransferase
MHEVSAAAAAFVVIVADYDVLPPMLHGRCLICRLAPPLVLTDEQCLEAAELIKKTIMSYDN